MCAAMVAASLAADDLHATGFHATVAKLLELVNGRGLDDKALDFIISSLVRGAWPLNLEALPRLVEVRMGLQ